MEGLHEPVVEAGGDGPLPVFVFAQPGHGSQDSRLETWPLAELAGQLTPVHAGHPDVGQHDVSDDLL